jgi:hypothetical protein
MLVYERQLDPILEATRCTVPADRVGTSLVIGYFYSQLKSVSLGWFTNKLIGHLVISTAWWDMLCGQVADNLSR